VINQTRPKGRQVLARTLVALGLVLLTPAVVSHSASAQSASYSDPMADTAAEALRVFGGRPAAPANGVVQANTAKPPTSPTVVTAGGGVSTSIVVVTTVAPVTTPTVPAASANAQTTPGVQAAAGPVGSSWNSVVVDTDALAGYVEGTPVVDDQSPEAKASIAALPTEPQARYIKALEQLADMVSVRTKVPSSELVKVWSSTDPRRMKAVLSALAQVGTRYRYTGNQPGGFDCSGLTSYAWSQAGVKIPRTSGEQVSKLSPRSFGDMQPGDLVWRPGHIMMYLGVGDAAVHAPQTGKTVEVKKIGRSSKYVSPL
jgi:peptidoglycan DL-endopeptidase CwlO